ncbi:hypothetical protein BV20DRAFT_607584 [Pilatotrama ljubarskyi]|nr:hypothetical protein BV20DRAFT_607584 [Pilatotrama ljubarskyi]
MPLDERRLLLNGLQPSRLSSGGGPYDSRPTKRQKTEGLNSRYDRMIQTVNVMHGAPFRSTAERGGGRRGVPSSSGTRYDVRRASFNASDAYHSSRSGQDLVTLKRRTSARLTSHPDIFAPDAFRDPDFAERLPPWLRGTISSLDPKHPIHLLVPGDPAHGHLVLRTPPSPSLYLPTLYRRVLLQTPTPGRAIMTRVGISFIKTP